MEQQQPPALIKEENPEYTIDEIYEVCAILNNSLRIPMEIALSIVDMAQFWIRETASRRDSIYVHCSSPYEAYISLPVPVLPVRRLRFRTESHDQGPVSVFLTMGGRATC